MQQVRFPQAPVRFPQVPMRFQQVLLHQTDRPRQQGQDPAEPVVSTTPIMNPICTTTRYPFKPDNM